LIDVVNDRPGELAGIVDRGFLGEDRTTEVAGIIEA
jgi:hypothetical protein